MSENQLKSEELEKAKVLSSSKSLSMCQAVVIKTIIRKSRANISIMSFDSGEGLTEKTAPFDAFCQVIEGKSEVVIEKFPIS